MSLLWNLPNQITLARIGLAFLYILFQTWGLQERSFLTHSVTLVIFIIAGISDWLDGYLARKMNLLSDFGRLFDPLADKILICAALIGLMAHQLIPYWMVVLIISREFLITGLRLVALQQGSILAAERAGKHKTVSQIITIIVGLLYLSLKELDQAGDGGFYAHLLSQSQPWLNLWTLFVSIGSGIYYLWKNRKLLA
ncbi:MAG: CDP-diacylglycerol--glycerol-3-phosphate 3-phosphatidyltransferase [Verrucomicrobiota bacterium]